MDNKFTPSRKVMVLLLMITTLLTLQVHPVSFADSEFSATTESESHSAYERIDFGEITKMLIPNRSQPIKLFSKPKENNPALLRLENPVIESELIGIEHRFTPCMRERIKRLVPYKINGTNSKQLTPSF